MKILVTGSKGFVGKYLYELLKKQGHEVFGFNLRDGQDLRNYENVRLAIDTIRPDKIFHLAALAYVPESFVDPRRAIDTNITGSLNIIEAVRNIGLKTKIHLCGTSEEYGDSCNGDGYVTETSLPKPKSPYAIGKLGMDYIGQFYGEAYGMNIVVTRTFNHTGPGRGEMYAESAFAKQIAEIEKGERDTLRHGDLRSIRNYTDVRDIVKAYTLAIDLPNGVYNICSDRSATIAEVLEILKGYAKIHIPALEDKNLIRPADFSFNQPSCDKFKELAKWEPTITLEKTLLDILNNWRSTLK